MSVIGCVETRFHFIWLFSVPSGDDILLSTRPRGKSVVAAGFVLGTDHLGPVSNDWNDGLIKTHVWENRAQPICAANGALFASSLLLLWGNTLPHPGSFSAARQGTNQQEKRENRVWCSIIRRKSHSHPPPCNIASSNTHSNTHKQRNTRRKMQCCC